jgi:hypothetical protein
VTKVSGGIGTGTLIHPRVVVYSAHSGADVDSILLTDDQKATSREIAVQRSIRHPEWKDDASALGMGVDVAYALLETPVDDIVPVPILMGCEVEQYLVVGAEVVLAGFGAFQSDLSIDGKKRQVKTTIHAFEGPEVFVGGDGKGACIGDSGGPAFLQVSDGTWRVFGVTSRGKTSGCETGETYYGTIHGVMDWLDEELAPEGIDLTPCHDADGTWNPGPQCKGFPLDPGKGGGSWPDSCEAGELSGFSESCGPPFEDDGENSDEESSQDDESDEDVSGSSEGSESDDDASEGDTSTSQESDTSATDNGSSEADQSSADENGQSSAEESTVDDDEESDTSADTSDPEDPSSDGEKPPSHCGMPNDSWSGLAAWLFILTYLRRRRWAET